ncbi:MAG: response regulator transcription factor [Epsilonproteobacteria bacterium]|nr:response regulator transcription factor [Campylobacterota bacterium]
MNKTRALLVEDERDARDILKFYLNTIFDVVDVAEDGEKGFKIFKENYKKKRFYDIIITDIKMPKLDGLSMVEEITKLKNDQKYIIVSAYKDEDYLLKAISLNIAGYFVKPLDIDSMIELLKKIKQNALDQKKDARHLVHLNKTYSYDTITKTLYKDNKSVKFSKKESLLIEKLIDSLGKIVTNEDLKRFIWSEKDISDSTLRTTMKRVKDKIADDDFIISRKGFGYLVEKN